MKKLITIQVLILIIISNLAYAGGAILTAEKDSYWFPTTTPRKHVKKFTKDYNPFRVELLAEEVVVDIDDKEASTEITQTFFSTTKDTVRGYFLFSVPKEKTYSDVAMEVNEEKVRVQEIKAAEATKVFEDLVRRSSNANYWAYSNRTLYKVLIDSIMPGSLQNVKFSYKETLTTDNSIANYTYSTSMQSLSKNAPNEFSIQINVKDKNKLKNIYTPFHEMKTEHKGDSEAKLGLEVKKLNIDQDIQLYYSTNEKEVGYSLFSYKKPKEDGFFFLTFDAGIEKELALTQKDVTFVVDASESMKGYKMVGVRKAIQKCVQKLNDGDRFNVISFATDAETAFPKLTEKDETSVSKATQFVKELQPKGETNIEAALKKTFADKSTKRSRPHFILFISGGEPTVGKDDEEALIDIVEFANPENTRIFTFGIGDEVNTYLLDRLSSRKNGTRTYIMEEGEILETITAFYATISEPIITNLELRLGEGLKATDIYPKDLSSLDKNEPLTIVGRYKKGGKSGVSLIGDVNNQLKRHRFEANFASDDTQYGFVPQLWAARAVGATLDEVRLDGEEDELIDKIAILSKKYGIITPYTTHLIVENTNVSAEDKSAEETKKAKAVNKAIRIFDDADYSTEYEVLTDEVTGEESIACSEELQLLGQAQHVLDLRPGQDRMKCKTSKGSEIKNVATQYANVNGHIFYQTMDNYWVDIAIFNRKGNIEKIVFGSDKYFELANSNAEAATYMTLGTNVKFAAGGKVYNVYKKMKDGLETASKK